jgi:hypothetical protein
MPVTDFGWPLPKRQSYIQELSHDPQAKRYGTEIDFMDQKVALPVWRVAIGFPKYRLLNGRTSSLQQEWLATHPKFPKDFFAGDPERDEVQKVQHDLLKQLVGEKDLLPYFSRPDHKQSGYLILDHLGFVINGNRRLCAWRELLAKDSKLYSHFAYIDIVVLPKADDAAIDKLEGDLQLEPDILAGYMWHAFANMILDRMRLHHHDKKAIAQFYGKRETEVTDYLDMREYAVEYLKARGKEGQWSEVNKAEEAFRAMVAKRKQINGAGAKRLFEVGAFALLDDPKGGRLYEYIPDLHKYRETIRDRLLAEFPVQVPNEIANDPLGIDPQEVKSQQLAEVIDIPSNREKVAELIKEVIDTQESLNREKDSAQYVLKQLQKANAAIQSSLTGIHRPDSIRDGIAETIASIETGIKTLRKWLNNG